MNKIISVMIFLVLVINISFVGCTSKDYSNYKKEVGYKEYIRYVDTFGDFPTLYDKKAQKYYKNNVRECDDYLITDFMDGICINQYLGKSNIINVPEKLDGKPVIALGEYIYNEEDENLPLLAGAFSDVRNCELTISKTVKYISYSVFEEFYSDENIAPGVVVNTFESVKVDNENPYYLSENNCIYSKDKKTLFYIMPNQYTAYDEFIVPEEVETFKLVNPLFNQPYKIIFNKNIKKINACVELGNDGVTPLQDPEMKEFIDIMVEVFCYKGTVAEKWAKKHGLTYFYIEN